MRTLLPFSLLTILWFPSSLVAQDVKPIISWKAHDHQIFALAFSRDGRILATGSGTPGKAGEVTLWEARTGKEIAKLAGHKDFVASLAFSPDGKTLASGSLDKTVRLWDVAKRLETSVLTNDHEVRLLAWGDGGKQIGAVSNRGKLSVWDAASTKRLATFDGHDKGTLVAIAPDLKTLAFAVGDGELQGNVVTWDVAKKRELATHRGETGYVICAAFSPNGKLLASGSAGYLKGKVYPPETKLWDLASGKELAKLIGGRVSVNVLEFSPDGKTLAAGYYGRAAKLWDVATGKDFATFEHQGSVHGLAFSPDGKLLATGCAQGMIRVWKATTK